MSEAELPSELLVITGSSVDDSGVSTRRQLIPTKLATVAPVDIHALQSQVNVFLQQLSVVVADAPDKVGAMHFAELEVSAGIVFHGKGEIGLALLGHAEVGGEVNAGIKFVFKRS